MRSSRAPAKTSWRNSWRIEAATHLLFIDADIGFEPEQVFRLMDFDAPMSAAVYPIKRIDWDKVAAMAQAGRAQLHTAALSYMVEFVDSGPIATRNGFAKVSYAGTGFLMIRREALVEMIAHYPELRYARDHKPNDKLAGSPWRSALFNCMIDEQTGDLPERGLQLLPPLDRHGRRNLGRPAKQAHARRRSRFHRRYVDPVFSAAAEGE